MRIKDKKGFTLIELMVVIIIIAVLAAIAIPLYTSYTKHAKAGEASNLLGSCVTAAQVYYQRWGQYPSATGTLWDPSAGSGNQDLLPGVDLRAAKYFKYEITAVDNSSDPKTFTLKATGVAAPFTGGNDWLQVVVKSYGRPVWTSGNPSDIPAPE
ncbi:MAG: prepilin-type N-terminal cleavage/methylation domain-containing protein [Candidatus Aenigmatarchaeota archaeon]